MAKKRIDITVTPPGMFQSEYYAKARDETGREVAFAYGKDEREAKVKVVEKVRRIYPDAEIMW
jgi:hypothetical protein